MKYTSNDQLKGYLELHVVEQREKIANLQKQLTLIETTIANLGHVSDIPLYSVALKKFPTYNVISVRGRIESPKNEAVLWEKLAKERVLQKIQFASLALNIAVFHDEGFQKHDLDVEIQQAVVGRYHDTEAMEFKKIEETTAATLTFKGQYGLLPEANEEIIRWITDNHYRLDGKRFNIYHVSPETEESTGDMVTEVYFLVKTI